MPKIVGLEEICVHGKVLGFLTYTSFVAAEFDKRVKFHKVLYVEYLQSMKRYSNTEYIFRSWIPFVTGLGTFIIFYTSNIYKSLFYQEEPPTVVRFCYFLWLK